MIHAYNDLYLDGAMIRLGDMLEFAVLDLGYDPDAFFKLFIDSSFARKFEIGDIAIISGRSGPEIASMVIEETDYTMIDIHPIWREDRSDIFWAGYILAYFQWYYNLTYHEIWQHITIRKLQKLYPTLHEADILKSVETIERSMNSNVKNKIADLRIVRGWSQAELANRAGMSISQLQRLEYGERKVENLRLKTALNLAKALGVDIRTLI